MPITSAAIHVANRHELAPGFAARSGEERQHRDDSEGQHTWPSRLERIAGMTTFCAVITPEVL
jgi:hypothetical protein